LDSRFVILCGAVLAIFCVHAAYLVCLTEDAFITYRFASNWVAGHGLVWNPSEAPVEGYTNFLWLVVCSGLLLLDIDLPFATQAIGLAASVGVLVLTWRLARFAGASAQQSLLPCLALACSGPFAAWASSGMETSLFTLLVVAAMGFAARWAVESGPGTRAAIGASAMLVLATLTRPEGALVAAVVGGFALVHLLKDSKRSRTGAYAAAGGYAVLAGAYLMWRWYYFGYPLPNTFYAKTGGGIAQAMRGAGYVGLFALHFLLPWLVSAGVWVIAGRNRSHGVMREPIVVLFAALVAVYTAYIAAVGGDYMAMYRFFVPVLPALYLVLTAVVVQSLAGIGVAPMRMSLIKAGVLAGLIGTGFHSTPIEARFVEKPDFMHGNLRGVELERWYVARQRLIGRFFARYGRPGESLATGAIGAVAWESKLRVFDVHGIVDPHIAHHGVAREALGTGLPGHEKTDYEYIFDKKPTFYMFSRKLRRKPLAGIPQLVPEVDERVAREYKVGSVMLEDRANGQSGYFSFLERRDRADVRAGKPRHAPAAP
jgi:hypothetical protein